MIIERNHYAQMNVYIRVICLSSYVDVHKATIAQLCRGLDFEDMRMEEPTAYWKEDGFCEFHCCFRVSRSANNVFLRFYEQFGLDKNFRINVNENDSLDIGVYPSQQEMTADGNNAFIWLTM